MRQRACQVLIKGAGITGLTIARELVKRGAEDILIIEKEDTLGFHASGRNSGIVHAGIYYTPDTLKVKFCVVGNRLMKEFCYEKGLTLKDVKIRGSLTGGPERRCPFFIVTPFFSS